MRAPWERAKCARKGAGDENILSKSHCRFAPPRRISCRVMTAEQATETASDASTDHRIDQAIRVGLTAYSIALLILAGGFLLSAGWATALFPFSYASRGASYAFMAAILAAAA